MAASELWNAKEEKYVYAQDGIKRDTGDQIEFVKDIIETYGMFYVEDPFDEAYQKLYENLNTKQQNALTRVFNRYAVGGEGDGGNDSLRVDIEDWNYKDFFKDCLLGLFDKS